MKSNIVKLGRIQYGQFVIANFADSKKPNRVRILQCHSISQLTGQNHYVARLQPMVLLNLYVNWL